MDYEAVIMFAAAAPSATCLAYLGRQALRWRKNLAESERELDRIRRKAAKSTRVLPVGAR